MPENQIEQLFIEFLIIYGGYYMFRHYVSILSGGS
jgi:hypothetical protein